MKWSMMQDKEGDLPSVSFWCKTIFAFIKTLRKIIGSEAKADFSGKKRCAWRLMIVEESGRAGRER